LVCQPPSLPKSVTLAWPGAKPPADNWHCSAGVAALPVGQAGESVRKCPAAIDSTPIWLAGFHDTLPAGTSSTKGASGIEAVDQLASSGPCWRNMRCTSASTTPR
jgi:hypothetical protein